MSLLHFCSLKVTHICVYDTTYRYQINELFHTFVFIFRRATDYANFKYTEKSASSAKVM